MSIKIGIMGCGGIANQRHLRDLKNQAHRAGLVAFCDLIPERAEETAAEYGVPGAKIYTDYHNLLADPAIEVVHVLPPMCPTARSAWPLLTPAGC